MESGSGTACAARRAVVLSPCALFLSCLYPFSIAYSHSFPFFQQAFDIVAANITDDYARVLSFLGVFYDEQAPLPGAHLTFKCKLGGDKFDYFSLERPGSEITPDYVVILTFIPSFPESVQCIVLKSADEQNPSVVGSGADRGADLARLQKA